MNPDINLRGLSTFSGTKKGAEYAPFFVPEKDRCQFQKIFNGDLLFSLH